MARPRVLVNCAISLDGRLALPGRRPLRLSDEQDLRRVHRLRAASHAILVGVGTVLADDPSLRVKAAYAQGDDPLRVVLDTHGRTPPQARVVDGTAPTLVLHGPEAVPRWPHAEAAEVALEAGRLDVAHCLEALWGRGVRSVLVEGGGEVIRSFLEAGFVDAMTVYVAPQLVGDGAPGLWPGGGEPFPLRLERSESAGEGVLLWLRGPQLR